MSADEQISGIDFNPRLREGGDPESSEGTTNYLISIHASAKEATHAGGNYTNATGISIHASAKEATGIPPDLSRLKLYFNPRLREGGDMMVVYPRR